jgi:CheY-like chemotaxis protein/ribonuclease BN (tRNA processing enzyme)
MAVDALIFDDAPYFAGFLQAILEDLGLSSKLFPDGMGALEHIRREQPNIVFLDVMMPGADGLSLCKEIKADPSLARMKVVIVTGKVFMDDKARASWAKADLYVHKPFNVDEFTAQIQELLKGFRSSAQKPSNAVEPLRALAAGTAGATKSPPSVKSAATASPALSPWNIRFWGKSSDADCMSFVDRNRLIVIDAGSGMEDLAAAGVAEGIEEVWLFLSHYHRDHVQGLAHAQNWIRAGLRLHVVGPAESESLLPGLVDRALPASPVAVHSLWEGDFEEIPNLQVSAIYTMHPGACFAYRMQTRGRSAVFAPDSEIPPVRSGGGADNMEKLAGFAFGADLLIHDARYSDLDYPGVRDRGHSCPRAALDLAFRARVRSLVLYHLDAKYTAAERERMLAELRSNGDAATALSSCLLARNGLEIDL